MGDNFRITNNNFELPNASISPEESTNENQVPPTPVQASGISNISDSIVVGSDQSTFDLFGGMETFNKEIQTNDILLNSSITNERTVGPEDILGEFELSLGSDTSNEINQIPQGSPIDLERRTEEIMSEVSYLRSELSKTDPDVQGMMQSLLNLPAGDEAEVLHDLRTNDDVSRLIDDFFSNPKTAAQMGQLADNLQSVVSSYPGIQDVIDEIRSRL